MEAVKGSKLGGNREFLDLPITSRAVSRDGTTVAWLIFVNLAAGVRWGTGKLRAVKTHRCRHGYGLIGNFSPSLSGEHRA
jgi:hypothetical protein